MISIEVRAILAALERVLYLLLSLVGLGQALGIKLDKTATESTPYRIQGQADWIGQQLTGQPWSLPVLHNQLTAVIAALDGINAPVLAAIAALPAGSALIVPTDTENATAVWEYMIAQSNPDERVINAMAKEWLYTLAHSLAIYSATEGISDNQQPYYRYVFGTLSTDFSVGYHPTITNDARPANPDFSLALPADTVLSFMQRTQPAYGWTGQGPSGAPQTAIAWKKLWGTGFGAWWRSAFTEADLRAFAPKAAVAPVWPGLANVTLGMPVAIGADVTIPGPLDGVLLAVTTPPSGLSSFGMGGQLWYYRAGQIAFVTDNGDVETWQYITWTNALYCPRGMARATSAILRGLAGIEGTATPWVTA